MFGFKKIPFQCNPRIFWDVIHITSKLCNQPYPTSQGSKTKDTNLPIFISWGEGKANNLWLYPKLCQVPIIIVTYFVA